MTVDTDLATLRDELAWQLDYGNRASEHLQDFEEALDRVEAEIARLRSHSDEWERRYKQEHRTRHSMEDEIARLRLERDTEHNALMRSIEQHRDAERELARLQDGLREVCATDWNASEGITPFQFEQRIHGIASRALLADTPDHAPPDPR